MNNYQSVLDQLQSFGLDTSSGLIFGRLWRCKVAGSREKKGWYCLHEVTNNKNEPVIIGTYGIWIGTDPGTQTIEIEKTEFTQEQREAFKARLAEDKKSAELKQKLLAENAAQKAEYVWRNHFFEKGTCDYLDRKGVKAEGIRFSAKNSMAIPMCDSHGRIRGLQIIRDKAKTLEEIEKLKAENTPKNAKLIEKLRDRDKEYWPTGLQKKGSYHLIGIPNRIILVAEGYATGATIYETTKFPVAIAFDAGNIAPVVKNLKKKYRECKILICADNDTYQKCANCGESVNVNIDKDTCPHCKEPHKKKNAGIEAAKLAALENGCAWTAPTFADESAREEHYKKSKGKLTDFNDLKAIEGHPSVFNQIEAAIIAQDWRIAATRAEPPKQGGGESGKELPVPITSTEELLERFVLIQHMGGMMFDKKYRKRCMINDMKQLCTHSDIPKRYFESKQRKVFEESYIGFDPTGNNPLIKESNCNTFGGIEMQPTEGKCDLLLELLWYMGSKESNKEEIFTWVKRWLAYPLQHLGTKMKSSIVIFGDEGVGKNMFFDVILSIYGRYGCVIGQSVLEDKHNDFLSSRLFIQANEVASGSEKWHVQYMLKNLITDPVIRINPKNLPSYEERNFANMVFMSNNSIPVVIDNTDRRYVILETPKPLTKDFYSQVYEEIKNGGAQALYQYLLKLDLGDFTPDTPPPMTSAKENLMHLCSTSSKRFYDAWTNNEIENIEPIPCLSMDLFQLYQFWCRKTGNKSSPLHHASEEWRRIDGATVKKFKYILPNELKTDQRHIVIPHNSPEMQPGESKQKWLGNHIKAFSNAKKDYENSIN